jgi:malyl-CoA/(S)-citramalyl-CoA lyase
VDVVEEAGEQLDQIMIPKVSCAGDVHFVATLLDQIEEAVGLRQRIGISVLIETAIGMVNIDEIATACPSRMEAMVFGVADYAASLQSHTTSIGGADPNYAVLTDRNGTPERDRHWGDQWHYALSRIAVTCRAHGLRPIDGPFGDFNDPEGFLAAARRAAVLGYEGKWAIHPSQIELANDVFTPDAHIVDKTHRIIAAMRDAAANGSGAVSLDGRLIDAASIRMAETLLAKLEQIEAKENGTAQPARTRRDDLEERRVVRDRVLAPFADI